MLWIIEKDVFHEGNPQKMIDYAISKGWYTRWASYIPFGGGFEIQKSFGQEVNLFQPIVVYGSLNLVKYLHDMNWPYRPSIWTNEYGMSFRGYSEAFGEQSLNSIHLAKFYKMGEINEAKNKIFETDDKVFIRPNDSWKSFSGEVVCEEMFDQWYKSTSVYELSEDTEVVVCPKHSGKITGEWRFVIVNRHIVASSGYRANGRISHSEPAPSGAVELAEYICFNSGYAPAEVYCLDICRTENGKFFGLEVGSFNGAGLYDCDIPSVMDAVTNVAIKDYEFHKRQ